MKMIMHVFLYMHVYVHVHLLHMLICLNQFLVVSVRYLEGSIHVRGYIFHMQLGVKQRHSSWSWSKHWKQCQRPGKNGYFCKHVWANTVAAHPLFQQGGSYSSVWQREAVFASRKLNVIDSGQECVSNYCLPIGNISKGTTSTVWSRGALCLASIIVVGHDIWVSFPVTQSNCLAMSTCVVTLLGRGCASNRGGWCTRSLCIVIRQYWCGLGLKGEIHNYHWLELELGIFWMLSRCSYRVRGAQASV